MQSNKHAWHASFSSDRLMMKFTAIRFRKNGVGLLVFILVFFDKAKKMDVSNKGSKILTKTENFNKKRKLKDNFNHPNLSTFLYAKFLTEKQNLRTTSYELKPRSQFIHPFRQFIQTGPADQKSCFYFWRIIRPNPKF